MKKAILRTAALFAAFFMLAGGAAFPAFAEQNNVLLIGDGILAGSDLPGGALDCGEHLSGILGTSVLNMAWERCSSYQLSEQLAVCKNSVETAEIIILSVGSDDILPLIYNSVSTLTGQEIPDASTIAGAVKLASLIPSSTIEKFAKAYNVRQNFADMTNRYTANMKNALTSLRNANPGAELYILNIYYPFAGLEGEDKLRPYADAMLGDFNGAISELSALYDMTVIDVRAGFSENPGCADVRLGSIYPTAEGQQKLALFLYGALKNGAYFGSEKKSGEEGDINVEESREAAKESEEMQSAQVWNPTVEDDNDINAAPDAFNRSVNILPENNTGGYVYNPGLSARRVLTSIIKTAFIKAAASVWSFITENPEPVICLLFCGAMLFFALEARLCIKESIRSKFDNDR